MSIPNHALPDEVALCRFLTPDGEAHLGWLDQPNPHSQKPPVLVDLTRVSEGALTTVAQVLSYVSWHSYYAVSPVPLSDVASMVVLARPDHLDIPRPVWDDFSRWLSLTVPASFVVPLGAVTLLAPIDAQEMWVAGESAARPREAKTLARFREGDARLIAGPGQVIRARPSIERMMPGPALALLLNGQGGVAGYTIANAVGQPASAGADVPALPWDGVCARRVGARPQPRPKLPGRRLPACRYPPGAAGHGRIEDGRCRRGRHRGTWRAAQPGRLISLCRMSASWPAHHVV